MTSGTTPPGPNPSPRTSVLRPGAEQTVASRQCPISRASCLPPSSMRSCWGRPPCTLCWSAPWCSWPRSRERAPEASSEAEPATSSLLSSQHGFSFFHLQPVLLKSCFHLSAHPNSYSPLCSCTPGRS